MQRIFCAICAAATLALAMPAAAQPPPGDLDAVLAASAGALGLPGGRRPGWHAVLRGTAAGLPATVDAFSDPARGAVAEYADLGVLKQADGFDGSLAWNRDDKGFVWVDGSEQGRSAAVNEAFRQTGALWSANRAGAAVSLSAPQTLGGATDDVVTVTPPGSVIPFDLWIDRTTHLPARIVETVGTSTKTTDLTQYRRVDGGAAVAYRIKTSSTDGNDSDLTIVSLVFDPPGLAQQVSKPRSTVDDFSIAGGSQTTVPVRLIDNHVYLDVMLDGKGPYHFIFDTGGRNIVDSAVARDLGIGGAGSLQGGGVGEKTEEFRFARIRSLRIGAAELRDQLFITLPIRRGFAVAGSAPVDGLIGFEVLARFLTTFDYERGSVTLRMPGTGALPGTAVPFVFADEQPQLACSVDGVRGACLVDTGSRSSIDLFSPFLAAHPALVSANATAPGVNGFGVGGPDIGRLGRLDSLVIGGFEMRALIAGYSLARKGAFAVPGIAGNIGGGVWRRFTVSFDYPNSTMALQPNVNFSAPDEIERSGLFLVKIGGHVVAAGVRPGTPAAQAGLARNDVILTIDGASGDAMTLGDARAVFRRPAGTVVRLTIRHEGGSAPQEVTLTLKDYV